MQIKNRGTGAGGSRTNQNGIKFEQNTYLKKWIEEKGFFLKHIGKSTERTQLFEIYGDCNFLKFIGYYGRQSKIYKALIFAIPKITKDVINLLFSKKINPDGFILNIKTKTLVIFEKKWQQGSGSVDEKIQTAPFKIKMFKRLLKGTGYKVKYQYILSSWFQRDEYRNVKEYYSKNKDINIWVEGENLRDISIDEYVKKS